MNILPLIILFSNLTYAKLPSQYPSPRHNQKVVLVNYDFVKSNIIYQHGRDHHKNKIEIYVAKKEIVSACNAVRMMGKSISAKKVPNFNKPYYEYHKPIIPEDMGGYLSTGVGCDGRKEERFIPAGDSVNLKWPSKSDKVGHIFYIPRHMKIKVDSILK